MATHAPRSTVELDCLAPASPGVWQRGRTIVRRDTSLPTRSVTAYSEDRRIVVRHNLAARHLADSLVDSVTSVVTAAGGGRAEFETAMVGLVRTTVDDPHEAWATFYRNSLAELLDGTAAFAPVHRRAADLTTGSVLDLGSCFGFFPLQLALADPDRSVIATDVHRATMELLARTSRRIGVPVVTRACDAADLPFPDGMVDTVTALHLLEHVDHGTGMRVLREACRVARRRVVVAVPYEAAPELCHGHVRSFDRASLHCIGSELGVDYIVFDHHGGWLVIDVG
ncbi:mycofactocin oligosaccharide methyltransferase MftM [Williamsia serinedens]|uniref:Methyltransferase domain-containing protein n=1 Tax=Williamsia serinedens TaxID=391736 RepID=A0ABT1H2J5_9NOCA|nr:mycofactocin oligosaccharide methyltransferase MftM [Williamsia serinedens]MCP2161447.1 Methyltransferase domain-containing protein [Williamsia serinedens]